MSKKKKKREIPVIPGLFDTHAHLDDERFDEDRLEVIERARQVGVERILTVDSEPHRIGVSSALAARHPGIYAASGVHPHEASKVDEAVLESVWRQLVETPRVRAVGEIGLDYYYMNSPRESQIRVFREMLHLALESGKPVVVHVRDAHEDAIRILSETDIGRVGGVIHCFSGGPDEAEAYLSMGLFISISGVVTYKKADLLREVAASLPADRILVETDSPYLGPGDRRGRRCEPAYVAFTTERLAEVRGVGPQDLARQTKDNGLRLFGIQPVEQALGPLVRERDGRLFLRVTGRSRLGRACSDLWPPSRQEPLVLHANAASNEGLSREPLLSDLLEALEGRDLSGYEAVVITGGEPTMRWDLVPELASELRGRGVARLALDTDGLAGLEGGERVWDEVSGLFDEVSVCLPAGDAETYARLCSGPLAKRGFDIAIQTLRRLRGRGLQVRLLCPASARSHLRHCRHLASRNGVALEFRAG